MTDEELKQLFKKNKWKYEPQSIAIYYLSKISRITKDPVSITKPTLYRDNFNLNPFNHQPLSLGMVKKRPSLTHSINQSLIKCAESSHLDFSFTRREVYDSLSDEDNHSITDYYNQAIEDISNTTTLTDHDRHAQLIVLNSFKFKARMQVLNYLQECGVTHKHETRWTVEYDEEVDCYLFKVGSYYTE